MFRSIALTCVLASLFAAPTFAQQNPNAYLVPKALRDANGYYSGSARQKHASGHARILYQMGKSNPKVSKEVVQEHVQAIKSNSEAALKEFSKIKASNPDSKEVAKSVETLKSHHEKVLAMCNMLDEACKKGDAEGVMICDCCLTMVKELDAAGKEADKIRDALKITPLTEPTHNHAEKK